MIIRESGIAAAIEWAGAAWALGFAVNTVLTADRLTSPQWLSLMTIPGGKWFWSGLFGGSALLLMYSLLRTRYRLCGIGLAGIGAGSSGIAVFYLVAPIFDLGPITLGYWPWFVPAGLALVFAIANSWPLQR